MKYGTLVRIPNVENIKEVCDVKFAKLVDLGLESCQLVYKPPVYTEEAADIIKESANKYNIEISAQFCGFYDTNLLWDTHYDYHLAGINSPIFGGDRIQYLLSAIPFMRKLGVTDMIIHAGFVPNNPFAPEYSKMLSCVRLLGLRLKEKGLNLLFETGGESPITLLRLIQDCELDNLYVNLDTANLIMYGYGNPVDAIYTFGKYVRNVHAKDGMPPTNPKKVGQEVTIGTGFVDFDKVMQMLCENGYDRFITIEREIVGGDQEKAIAEAIEYLKEKVQKNYK